MTHFHANKIEDNGSERAVTALGYGSAPFFTRAAAQSAMLKESGSLAGQPSWTLVEAKISGEGLDVVEFLNRSGSRLTLTVWGCSCEDGSAAEARGR